MKLLLDAMFSPEIARQLRRRGHDVIGAIERADLAPLRDPRLFAAAQADQRAIVTENVPDFLDLDRLYREEARAHFGLILTTDRRFSRDSERHIGQLVLALDTFLRTQASGPRAESLIHRDLGRAVGGLTRAGAETYISYEMPYWAVRGSTWRAFPLSRPATSLPR